MRRQPVRSLMLCIASLAAIAATACSSPATSSPTAGAAATSKPQTTSAQVSLTDANQFQPATLSVPTGTTVTWTNSGSTQHTVTDDPSKAVSATDAALPAGAQPWDSGILNGGQTFTHAFTTPGTYKYFCIPHEALGMVATITVT